ncbi:MAG TPA: acyl-CoA dehydrogenase domain-containing protein, partial [Legionellaceae bacterium]|nr:acyl-CoA dehydrogenase domain-containing protein [Legionellaceae bacterium]
FPTPVIGGLLRFFLFPMGQTMAYPSDKQSHQLAQLMQHSNDYRDLIKKSVFLSGDPHQPVDRMEHAFELLDKHADLYHAIIVKTRGNRENLHHRLLQKVQEGELRVEDVDKLMAIEQACWDAIQVDEFPFDAVNSRHCDPVENE